MALFGMDPRSLALFRILLGCLTFEDAWFRISFAADFMSDEGWWPRSMVPHNNSIFMLTGSTFYLRMLLLPYCVASVFMLVGYHTRIAILMSHFYVSQLVGRNIHINGGGDQMLRMLLLWANFLPLDLRYSLAAKFKRLARVTQYREYLSRTHKEDKDAVYQSKWTERGDAGEKKEYLVISVGAFAVLMNTFVVYLFNALYKTGDTWRKEYTAILRVLQIVQFTTPLGDLFLRAAPRSLLIFSTFFAFHLEAFGWMLVIMPHSFLRGYPRCIGVFLFMSLHAGIFVFMAIGHFPYSCIALWSQFLPSIVWERLAPKLLGSGARMAVRESAEVQAKGLRGGAWGEKAGADGNIGGESDSQWCSDARVPRRWYLMMVVTVVALADFVILPLLPQLWQQNRGNILVGTPVICLYAVTFRQSIVRFVCGSGKWWEERPASMLAAFLFIISMSCVTEKFTGLRKPRWFDGFVLGLELGQSWNMFAPDPTSESYWISMPAIFRRDTPRPSASRDLFCLGGPTRRQEIIEMHKTQNYEPWARPPFGWAGSHSGGLQANHYAHQRWRKFFSQYWGVNDAKRPQNSAAQKERRTLYLAHGRYICRLWNEGLEQSDADYLVVFEVVVYTRYVSDSGRLLPQEARTSAWTHHCTDDVAARAITSPLPGSPSSYNISTGAWYLTPVKLHPIAACAQGCTFLSPAQQKIETERRQQQMKLDNDDD